MSYANAKYIGDGSTKVFSIPFQYLDKEHVKVAIDGVEQTSFSFPTDSSVELSEAPADESIVTVFRETPKYRLVDFQNGSMLNADTLDLDSNQTSFIVQEAFDKAIESLMVDLDNVFNAHDRRIKNVEDPVLPKDVSNKRYTDAIVEKAKVHADDAEFQANTALSYKNEASNQASLASQEVDKAKDEVSKATQEAEDAHASAHESALSAALSLKQANRAENEADRAHKASEFYENVKPDSITFNDKILFRYNATLDALEMIRKEA